MDPAPPLPGAIPRWLPSGVVHPDIPAILGLGLLVAVSFFPALQAGFVWDDKIWTSARAVQEWSGLWQLWFDTENTYSAGNTRESHFWPILYSSLWLEHKLWGFSPLGYHLVNLLLHFANTWLVWRLLWRLAVPGAWFIAALFAVHPVHVEAVAWVIARKDLLSTLFYLGAALTYLRFVDAPDAKRYLLALALFVAGLLSKSMAVTLPAGLLICHWWQQGRVTSTDVLRLLPFFLVGLVAGLADMSFYNARETASFDHSVVDRLLISAQALWFYVGKLLWPVGLAVIYPRWDIDPMAPLGWAYVAAALGVAALLWCLRKRIGRGPLAGAAFFAVTLSPVLGLVDSTFMQWSFVADRYQYLASLGLIAVIAGGAVHVAARLSGAWRTGGVVVAGMVLVMLGTLTWRQAGIYRDDTTFYKHVISLNPVARDAHLNLSAALSAKGQNEEALAAALVAAQQRPDFVNAYINLGHVLIELRRFDEAERYLRRGQKIDPRHPKVLLNLGAALERQQRYEEALAYYDEVVKFYDGVIELNAEDISAYVARGGLLIRMQRYDEVIESLKPVVARPPGLPSARRLQARLHAQLSVAARKLGQPDEAGRQRRRVLGLATDRPVYLQDLAESLRRQGRYDEALEWYGIVIERDPGFGLAYAGMGDTLFHMQRYDDAAERLEQAVPLLSDSSQLSALHVFLGRTAEARGQAKTAEEEYKHALAANPRNLDALKYLSSLHFNQQRYEETLDLLRVIIDVDPGNAESHLNLGVVLHMSGRTDDALQSVDQALSLDPNLEKARTTRDTIQQGLK